jgi:hypothetical protein
MILPPDYDYKEEERVVIQNVIYNYLYPIPYKDELRVWLIDIGLMEQRKPNPEAAASFIKEVIAKKHKNNPDYISELGRIREIWTRGRAVPIINRPSRHKGTDFKLYRPGRLTYTPQINIQGKYINQMTPKQALVAISKADTTNQIKTDLAVLILKEQGLI